MTNFAGETQAAEVHSLRSVLVAVVRRCRRNVIEASVIPAVLFYVCLVAGSLTAAYISALAYTYGAVGLRALRGRRVPPLLTLTVIGLTIRTIVAVISGSSFVYFVQPVLGTVAMSAALLGSIAMGRPMIAALAHEFWPITPEDASCPGVARHFRNLTVLWAGVNLVTAAVTLALLVSLPVGVYVPLKQVTGLMITFTGVYLTVTSSLQMARREGLTSLYVQAA
jgi:hypothetical protein